jgi:hypothetical protein
MKLFTGAIFSAVLGLSAWSATGFADQCYDIAKAAFDRAYASCQANPPCETLPGRTECDSVQTRTRTYCRPVKPGSNECIRAGTPNVLIGVYSVTCRNFDGCGRIVQTYSKEVGENYESCGC